MVEERITELEIKLAYAEDFIQQLNGVIAEQDKRLMSLEDDVRLMKKAIKEVGAGGGNDETANAAVDPVPSSG